MNQEQLDVVNTVQEVLRGFAIALITSGAVSDPAKFASVLQAFSANPRISPMAQAMLGDLAAGPDMLGKAQSPVN